MAQVRKERAYRAGVRVRIDAPGYSFHRCCGTVAQDARADQCVFVLRDGYGRERDGICTLVTSEVARLRDRAPNPAHAGDFTDFWWIKA